MRIKIPADPEPTVWISVTQITQIVICILNRFTLVTWGYHTF